MMSFVNNVTHSGKLKPDYHVLLISREKPRTDLKWWLINTNIFPKQYDYSILMHVKFK